MLNRFTHRKTMQNDSHPIGAHIHIFLTSTKMNNVVLWRRKYIILVLVALLHQSVSCLTHSTITLKFPSNLILIKLYTQRIRKTIFPNCDAHKFGISRDSIRDSFDFFAKNFSYSYLQYFIDLNCSLFGMWKKKCVYLFLLHSSFNLLVFHSIPCPYQTYYDFSLNVALQEFVWKMKL